MFEFEPDIVQAIAPQRDLSLLRLNHHRQPTNFALVGMALVAPHRKQRRESGHFRVHAGLFNDQWVHGRARFTLPPNRAAGFVTAFSNRLTGRMCDMCDMGDMGDMNIEVGFTLITRTHLH